MSRKRRDEYSETDGDDARREGASAGRQVRIKRERPVRNRRSRRKGEVAGIHMRCNKKSNW